jgi:UDP-N-acetylglucosamine pyrophosphorylase
MSRNIIVDYDGSIRLLEIAQVPSEHVEDFKSGKPPKFIYNALISNFFFSSPQVQDLQYQQPMAQPQGPQASHGQ